MVSTAPLQGVPCNTGVIVGMMYKMNADGRNIRQLAFEQDHTYNPTVTPDGRILYLRWDYTDTPHVWNRILFTMNPDGSNQTEFYGSNSYWPNSLFHARQVPDHPTKFVGIVTGHHVGRAGEMILFDRAKGRRETDGVVQRIADRHGLCRAADRGQADAAFLAEVPPSLSAQRQVLPGLLQADARFAVGHLPGRRVR